MSGDSAPRMLPADFAELMSDAIADDATRELLCRVTALREAARAALDSAPAQVAAAIEAYAPHLLALINALKQAPSGTRKLVAVSWLTPFTAKYVAKPGARFVGAMQCELAMLLVSLGMVHRRAARDALRGGDDDAAIRALALAAGVFAFSASLMLPASAPRDVFELTPEFSSMMRTLCKLEAQEIGARRAAASEDDGCSHGTMARVCAFVVSGVDACRASLRAMLGDGGAGRAEYRFGVVDLYLIITRQVARGAACAALARQERDQGRFGRAVALLRAGMPTPEESAACADRRALEHMPDFVEAAARFSAERLRPDLDAAVHDNESIYFEKVPPAREVSLPPGADIVGDAFAVPYAAPRPAPGFVLKLYDVGEEGGAGEGLLGKLYSLIAS